MKGLSHRVHLDVQVNHTPEDESTKQDTVTIDLPNAPWDEYYYPHSVDEEAKTWRNWPLMMIPCFAFSKHHCVLISTSFQYAYEVDKCTLFSHPSIPTFFMDPELINILPAAPEACHVCGRERSRHAGEGKGSLRLKGNGWGWVISQARARDC